MKFFQKYLIEFGSSDSTNSLWIFENFIGNMLQTFFYILMVSYNIYWLFSW